MAAEIIRKELIYSIPIEYIESEQNCITNISSICTMKSAKTGQDSFLL